MPIMSHILRRLGRWGAVLALWCSLANGASAAEKDWLDEMPSVPAVVQAVREQVELVRQKNPALAKDEDFLAEDIVGTFVLLRWVMDFQSAKEWHMSDRRRERMRKIAMDYMQVELAIGLGVGKRKGHIKDNCDHKDSYLNRLGQKMHATPVECYQHRFHVDLSNVYPSFDHRNAIFPLLFCDRARYYLDLVRERILKAPSPNPKSAETLSLPDGVRPLGPAVCTHHGYESDSNGNGLCDDWEKPLPKMALATAAARPGCPAAIHTADEVAQLALELAWHKTRSFGDNTEWGGLIYELVPNDFRYTAPEVGVAAKPGDVAKVEGSVLSYVWLTLEKKAKLDGKEVKLIANYHTHPRNHNPTYLSIKDINAAIPDLEKKDPADPAKKLPDPGYGTVYMRGANGEMCGIHKYKYDPEAEPKHVRVEPLEEKAAKQPASFWGRVAEKLNKNGLGVLSADGKWTYMTADERQEREDSRRSATTWIPLAAGHQPCPCDKLGECTFRSRLKEWSQDWDKWPQARGKASRAWEVVKGWGNQGLDVVKGGASRAWEAISNLFAR